MGRALRWLVLLTLLSVTGALSPMVRAATFDPHFTWRTLHTPHFRITFHGGEEQLAEELAAIAEEIWAELTADVGTTPVRPIEVVLVDRTDSANGYAMTLPVNTIVIYVTAPQEDSTLSLYADWSDAILTHELAHILHLDTVEGLPRLLRRVLGRIVSTNQISPAWIVEGYATYQETRLTPGGRGRSNMVDMIKRMSVLEDAFPPLGNLDGWQSDPPGGNLRYLFGQDFLQFIADQQPVRDPPVDPWARWIHAYGGWVPYWLPARRVFGATFIQFYEDWKEHLEQRYRTQAEAIEDEGLTPFEVLTDPYDSCYGPTTSPDGARVVWACSDRRTGSDIYLAGGDATEPYVEIEDRFARDFTWRPDSEAFAFSSSHVVDRFNVYEDVYFHVVVESEEGWQWPWNRDTEGAVQLMTSGKRARNPVFSPDGRELLVVVNEVQNNQLARLTVDKRLVELTEFADHTQLSTPRYDPDGERLALSMWRDGRRDIWIFDIEGRPLVQVTDDAHHDMDPAWSADGRTLFFSSDRSGVFNIYAIDLETADLWQVTNVLGGAFHADPHPDGSSILFESFSHWGMNVARMSLDRDAWRERGRAPVISLQPVEAPEAPEAPESRAVDEAPGSAWGAVLETDPSGDPGNTPTPEHGESLAPLPDGSPEPSLDVDSSPVPESAPDPEPEPSPESAPDPEPEPSPESAPDPEPEPSPDRSPAPASEPEPQVNPGPGRGHPSMTRSELRDSLFEGGIHQGMPGMDGLGAPFFSLSRLPGPVANSDAPSSGPDADDPLSTEAGPPEEEDYPFSVPVERYSPLSTLIPPRFVAPGMYQTSYGYMGYLSTGGMDTLRRYLYSGFASYRTDSRYLGWGASAAWNRWIPVVTTGIYSYTVPYDDIYETTSLPESGGGWLPSVQSINETYWDRRTKSYLQMSIPSGERRVWFARWSGTSRQALNPLPEAVYHSALPTRGYLSYVGGGWRYAHSKSYTKSISPEDARIVSVVGQATIPAKPEPAGGLGSYILDDDGEEQSFAQLQGTLEWREYQTVPWIPNHVLAWKLAMGATFGDTLRYGSFRLGGDFGESAYYTLPDEWRAVRGFPTATVYGDWFYLGAMEYRLPLGWLDRGFGTLPFFARYLSAATFVDVGNAFFELPVDPQEASALVGDTLVGTGAEIRGTAILGWGVSVRVRVGYAFAVMGNGYSPGSAEGLYAWFGGSF